MVHFSEDDLAYLRGRGIFDEGFLHYLENFHFTGDIYAVPEGTPSLVSKLGITTNDKKLQKS